ncbi:MAG: phosphate acyltransferase PlsX [Anaerolineales bacterium]|nr:phosphate acyltransferase PlsX [Anaerolineales bacterium]
MKIALDAMGGDHAPAAAVHAAVWAARDFKLTVQLVGRPQAIEAELAKHQTAGLNLPIIPASEVIEMHEHPATAVKNKKDASMVVAIELLKTKASDAFVSAGNSGGVLAAALFGLGRIKGIKRPALSVIFPNESPHGFCFLLDVGANTDARPEFLLQFALMGYHYASQVLNIPNPRVGLLSTGEEEDKGSMLVQEVTPLLKVSNLNFVGNVEGKDIPAGLADVVVTDGFTGNVFIKGAEGVASMIVKALEREIKARPLAAAGALLVRPAFRALKAKLDYREYGGGPLLGVNGVVIIAHGRSDAYAIRNAIRVAKQAAEKNIVGVIEQGLNEAKSQRDNEAMTQRVSEAD